MTTIFHVPKSHTATMIMCMISATDGGDATAHFPLPKDGGGGDLREDDGLTLKVEKEEEEILHNRGFPSEEGVPRKMTTTPAKC